MAKVITARYEGTCRKCGGHISPGEQITLDGGASHQHCPENPAVVIPTVRSAMFTKLSEDENGMVFGIRVKDPDDARELSGQTVTVITSKGKSFTEELGELVRSVGRYEAVYAKAPMPGEDVVPAGFYAIDVLDPGEGRNDVMFVQVWRRGSAVKVYLQLGPDDRGRALDTREYLGRIIEAGVADAAIRYGQLLRRCSRCNAELTNRLSRELNIGPVCGGHFYSKEAWSSIKKSKTADLRSRGFDPFETHSTEMWARIVEWWNPATGERLDKAPTVRFRVRPADVLTGDEECSCSRCQPEGGES